MPQHFGDEVTCMSNLRTINKSARWETPHYAFPFLIRRLSLSLSLTNIKSPSTTQTAKPHRRPPNPHHHLSHTINEPPPPLSHHIPSEVTTTAEFTTFGHQHHLQSHRRANPSSPLSPNHHTHLTAALNFSTTFGHPNH
ncbi:hypothetical protein PIB30_093882 [Stylosanthes scabra]|uniref:Uncharacterized protein n=1 Tax=Stylosanthes scabra TaxID=79078 RepID=A0ABU6VTT1_9FABA|nr:hypothetical protein [Stylosanthes scabra]